MDKLEFTTPEGQQPDREQLWLCLNVGTRENPDWQPLCYGTPSASTSVDWQKSTETDVLGNVHPKLKKPQKTQEFSPLPFVVGQKAVEYLFEVCVWDEDARKASNMDVLEVYRFAKKKGGTGMAAKRYLGSCVETTGYGGEGGDGLDMPITVTYGGTMQKGTVTLGENDVISFTKDDTL